MSFTVLSAMREMALSFISEEIGCREVGDIGSSVWDPAVFVFVGGGLHGKETEGTVQQDGLDYVFVVFLIDLKNADLRVVIFCKLTYSLANLIHTCHYHVSHFSPFFNGCRKLAMLEDDTPILNLAYKYLIG